MRRSGETFSMASRGSPEVSEGETPAWGRAKERKRDTSLFCLLFKISLPTPASKESISAEGGIESSSHLFSGDVPYRTSTIKHDSYL